MTLSRKLAQLILMKNVPVEDVTDALRKYNLLSLLPSVYEAVRMETREQSKGDVIRIESPFDLNNDALSRIKRIVGNDLAPTEVIINKNILAGFKARFKGRLYDGSAERIIKQLTK